MCLRHCTRKEELTRGLAFLEFVILKNDIGTRKQIKFRREFNGKNKLKKKKPQMHWLNHVFVCACAKILWLNFLNLVVSYCQSNFGTSVLVNRLKCLTFEMAFCM